MQPADLYLLNLHCKALISVGRYDSAASPVVNLAGNAHPIVCTHAKNFSPSTSPSPNPMPTLPPSRRGYTRRRPGGPKDGPALVVEGRREPSSSGSAENGLPPATPSSVIPVPGPDPGIGHRNPAAPRLRRRTPRHPMPTNSSLAVQTHGGWIPAQGRDDGGEARHLPQAPKPHPHPPNINHLTPRSSPSPNPCLHFPRPAADTPGGVLARRGRRWW
jgi:hypothetical protein